MARCLECEGNPRHQRGADGKLGDAFIKPLDAKVMLYSRVPHESVSLNNLSECNVLGCLEQAALVFTAKRVPRRCGTSDGVYIRRFVSLSNIRFVDGELGSDRQSGAKSRPQKVAVKRRATFAAFLAFFTWAVIRNRLTMTTPRYVAFGVQPTHSP